MKKPADMKSPAEAPSLPEPPAPPSAHKELVDLLIGLDEFLSNAKEHLVALAVANDNLGMAETKGMLRTATQFRVQIAARVLALQQERIPMSGEQPE